MMSNDTMLRMSGRALAAVLIACGPAASPARATTVPLGGTGQMGYTYEYIGDASGYSTATGVDYSLAVPGQYAFFQQFTSAQVYTTSLGPSPVGQYNYEDRYQFSIGAAASGDVLTASLNLGSLYNISNLQFRLYQLPASPTFTGPGIPAGSTQITPWVGQSSPGVTVTGTAFSETFSGIQAGSYILDIAGIANGQLGGTDIGQLNLAPVPIPSSLLLLASGLGLFAGLGRRLTSRG